MTSGFSPLANIYILGVGCRFLVSDFASGMQQSSVRLADHIYTKWVMRTPMHTAVLASAPNFGSVSFLRTQFFDTTLDVKPVSPLGRLDLRCACSLFPYQLICSLRSTLCHFFLQVKRTNLCFSMVGSEVVD